MIRRIMQKRIPSQLTDEELIAAVAELAASERRTTVALIAHLAEMDARRLHRGAGFPSLFVYCTQVLRLSEGGAYNRIKAARAVRRFPAVLEMLDEGGLNLGTLRLLIPHLNAENHATLLAAASGKSKREVERWLAGLFPKPDVTPLIRKLPAPRAEAGTGTAAATDVKPDWGLPIVRAHPDATAPDGEATAHGKLMPEPARLNRRAASCGTLSPAPRHPLMSALSADRYQIRFTASAQTCEKLERAQDLLRHAVPNGDPAEIFDRALTALLAELERRRFAAAERPRTGRPTAEGSRAIPATVKRAVVARDEGRCAFVADTGRRCGTRAFLEFHHVIPYARGGPATVGNIQLRCRAHNDYEADLDYGDRRGKAANWSRDQLAGGTVAATGMWEGVGTATVAGMSAGAGAGTDTSAGTGLTQRKVDRAPDVLAGRTVERHA